jgi:Domain of unknown function (DUF5107)
MMKHSKSNTAFTRVRGGKGLCVLSLFALSACAGKENGAGDEPATSASLGDSTTGSTNSLATAGSTATGGESVASTASGPGASSGANTASGPGASSGANTASGASATGSDTSEHGAAGVGVGSGGTASDGTASDGKGAGGERGDDDGSGGVGGAPVSAGGAGGTGGVPVGPIGINDTVSRTDSTFTFKHFPIEANDSFVWNGPTVPSPPPITTTYDTTVLENSYLRVTLLPSYGGRILSIVHKPTGRELLYQNPIGTPYLMGEDIFYYNYLVIMGGIFPSFPEPEHGKYWNQPYSFEVVSEGPEAITVRMSRKDDLDLAAGVPARYDVGRTDVLVELDVTLRAGRANLELQTKLTNTRSESVPTFEYWTVTTLAPGSIPGETAIPLNTRILANMDKVHLLESSWSWFGDAEERVNENEEVFLWNNLVRFENWADQGTGFANPSYQTNWSGLINDDAGMGILRASDNVETPGLKLWTFGKQCLDVDINDGEQWLRPTIEMWHGVTPEFWKRKTFAANETRQWTDSYFAFLGLDEITSANANGALQLTTSAAGDSTVVEVKATLNVPGQNVSAVLRVDGVEVGEQALVVPSTEPATATFTLPKGDVPAGAVLEAEFLEQGTSLLAGQIAAP